MTYAGSANGDVVERFAYACSTNTNGNESNGHVYKLIGMTHALFCPGKPAFGLVEQAFGLMELK